MGGPAITRKTQTDIDNIMREKQSWLLNMFCWQIIREDCVKSDHVSPASFIVFAKQPT